jgi:chloramphenicol 3-O-phosphotransferase
VAERGTIFLITGTPGSGKSSVAAALAKRYPFGIHIPVDDLREWVVSGIAHPVPLWTEETGRQFRLARQAALEIARIYAGAGFAVVIDDIIFPDEAARGMVEALSGYDVHKVVLHPDLDTALRRNAERTNKQFDTGVLTETIRSLHGAFARADFTGAGWQVIDNTHLDVEETVDRILSGQHITDDP